MLKVICGVNLFFFCMFGILVGMIDIKNCLIIIRIIERFGKSVCDIVGKK